jgi:DNA-3-methyladenine glycosylase I
METEPILNPYCRFVAGLPDSDVNRRYHDQAYGFPIQDDSELFGRLILEINQAGLSWATILKKEANFRSAYDGFAIDCIAAYGEADRQRLLGDPGIIRNRLKIDAAIENARRILELQQAMDSFKGWLDAHHPRSLPDWTKLFKQTFRFTGGEIVKEFLMSTGYLPGAHEVSCPVYQEILSLQPPWLSPRT